jgi:hypothetical protein
MPISDQLMLAATTGPDYMKAKVDQQTLRNAIAAGQHNAIMYPQIEKTGALGLQQQQIAMEDQRKLSDLNMRRAAAAGSPVNPGQVAGPQSAVLPGMVGVTAAPMTAGGTAAPGVGGLMDPGYINDAVAAGGSSGGVNALRQNYLKQLEAKALADKNAAESKHYDSQTAGIRLNVAGQAANAVLQLPKEQRPAGYARARAYLIQQGYVNADQTPEQYPGDDVLQQHVNQSVEVEKLLDMQNKKNAEARAAALAPYQLQTAATNAKTGQLGLAGQTLGSAMNQDQWDAARAALPPDQQAITPVMFSKAAADQARRVGMSGEQQTTADQAAAALEQTRIRDTNTAANEAVLRQQGASRLGIEGARLGLERQRLGFDLAGGVSDAARMAVDGRMNPATLQRLLRSQPGLLGQIRQLDPDFDEANLDNRYNTLKEFTNTSLSKAGGQAIALNTLIHHADLYMQAAQALKNHTFVPGNAVYNTIATTFGAAPPQNAALLARFLAGETGKVATGGIPAEGEVNGILKNLNTSGSEDQLMNAGRSILQIAAGKATPLIERAHKAKIDNVVDVIGPHAQDILKRRGFDANMQPAAGGGAPGQIVVTDPNGGAHYFTNQKAADEFKRAAGIH